MEKNGCNYVENEKAVKTVDR